MKTDKKTTEASIMLNFRKLKQDFSPALVKEGKELFDQKKVVSAKILELDNKIIKVSARILGQYDNCYEIQIEIDRNECELVDSDCDCPYNYDCVHLTALLFYLEIHIDEIMVAYSKEKDIHQIAQDSDFNDEEKQDLLQKFKQAETKQQQKQEELYQKQVLQEYVVASELLATSPFFRMFEKPEIDKAELAIIFSLPQKVDAPVELQIALRLPFRSKPLHIPIPKKFFEALRYEEPIFISGKRYFFSMESFDLDQREVVRMLLDYARFIEVQGNEKAQRIVHVDIEVLGMILVHVYERAMQHIIPGSYSSMDDDLPTMPGVYEGSMETPIRFCPHHTKFRFALDYIHPPVSKILLKPLILVEEKEISLEETRFFECAKPGMLHQGVYYKFPSCITRSHLRSLPHLKDIVVPEPLFGSFVENALPELSRLVDVAGENVIENFVTLPFTSDLKASCHLSFLDGELEAGLVFHYEGQTIPAVSNLLRYEHLDSFVTKQGVLARDLVEERKIIEDLFQDFLFQEEQGVFIARSEKKIVEFMTEVIPRNQHRVTFHCPQNLLDQVIYDKSSFRLHLSHSSKVNVYEVQLQVEGPLKGVKIDLLWECVALKKAYIELETAKNKGKKGTESGKLSKILVLDLEKISALVQIFDELGVTNLDDHTVERPLWSLVAIEEGQFEGLPVKFSISDKLIDIRKQMLGEMKLTFTGVPKEVRADLRNYQVEGVNWLERLRKMYLNGILADDMGLGKTLQTIVGITQHYSNSQNPSLIVCPTSLLYNWKEEFSKFNPRIKVMVVDGTPSQRKKMIEEIGKLDVVITSYTLLQKDIDTYRKVFFSYVVLDEAQHIKNRGTRNARSVKMIQSEHRLILSGTPIENSLDELWSLFDFLMPGFLNTYERFVEKYIRVSGQEQSKNLDYLRRKMSPFIMRRMKSDVLDDLPPVSEIVYHCQLTDTQMELYRSYAQSARDELVKLVQRDGFDRVQIHVLATLTRLKQICCHPAIFAKETPEPGDSDKYDMLLDLLQTLVEGKHKTVIFSQYTRMLQIMRDDFEKRGIRFSYLDGSSKNRLEIVRNFNEDESTSVFLVSLKAGGTGLNLVSADTVIHYDMWWNPAVESQATDRVHRIGQKRSVSSYKLITLGTIEEKIAEMQKQKKGLVKKIVSCDDEAIAKLTWEDVLELLKT